MGLRLSVASRLLRAALAWLALASLVGCATVVRMGNAPFGIRMRGSPAPAEVLRERDARWGAVEAAVAEYRSPSGAVSLLVIAVSFCDATAEPDTERDAWLIGTFDRLQASRGASGGVRAILRDGITTLAIVGVGEAPFPNPTPLQLEEQITRIPPSPSLCSGTAPPQSL
jgi:uncharacterized protein YceK